MALHLNGLSLFTGIGGLDLALKRWVRPVAYCELNPYARGVLLSRMASDDLVRAPIWDDVRTLRGGAIPVPIHAVYGGFPCQDLSVAGTRTGLGGERSGLFFELIRVVDEVRPAIVFLENVPGIRQHAHGVFAELAKLGFDARWLHLSAAEVGAPHKRERWWCLATHPDRVCLRDERRGQQSRALPSRARDDGAQESLANADSIGSERRHEDSGRETRGQAVGPRWAEVASLADAKSERWEQGRAEQSGRVGLSAPLQRGNSLGDTDGEREPQQEGSESGQRRWACDASWWSSEPDVGRVAHGVPARVDRLAGLGNAVVPACAREAFETLAGIRVA